MRRISISRASTDRAIPMPRSSALTDYLVAEPESVTPLRRAVLHGLRASRLRHALDHSCQPSVPLPRLLGAICPRTVARAAKVLGLQDRPVYRYRDSNRVIRPVFPGDCASTRGLRTARQRSGTLQTGADFHPTFTHASARRPRSGCPALGRLRPGGRLTAPTRACAPGDLGCDLRGHFETAVREAARDRARR